MNNPGRRMGDLVATISKYAKRITDFDIGIGWQTWGNYGSWSKWALSYDNSEGIGEITRKSMNMTIVTVLGFYFRIYLLGPHIEKANKGQGNNE